MKPNGLLITLSLIVAGVVLAVLSGLAFPLGHGVTGFWVAILVVTNGSIWFGGWGVIAAMIFPVLSSIATGVEPLHYLSIIPANLVEALIPAMAFRHLQADPGLRDRRSAVIYIVWGAIIPNALGGVIGVLPWLPMGDATWHDFALLSFDWAASNILVLVVAGVPLMLALSALLRRHGLLVDDWWRLGSVPANGAE